MSCSLIGSPQRDRLLRDLRERVFTAAALTPPGRIGVEVEWIPWDAGRRRVVPIHDDPLGPGSLPLLLDHGQRFGWTVRPGPHGVPCLDLPGGGSISYEPGGQIEYASPPLSSVAALADTLQRVVPALRSGLADHGIELLGRGIDPHTPLAEAPCVLPGKRYAAMHRYLSAIGDAGPRMMLQTAAIQVNVDLAPDPVLRWKVLNAAAPFLTAIFANSRLYEGSDTGFASFRARQWRLLDRRRTGLLGRGVAEPAEEYLDFALNASWIFGPSDREPEPFLEWLLRGEVTLEDWRRHLTTLFPEIRPRGFLEVRCIDALDPEWLAAPVALIAGIVSDETALRRAAAIVGEPDSELLQDAARAGLRDPRIAGPASELFAGALQDAERTGAADGAALDSARRYFECFTTRGTSPGDEAVGAAA